MDLIPVFSFLYLRGKCRSCGSKISVQYPVVEFSLAVLYVLIFWNYGFSINTILLFVLAFFTIAIFVYDIYHQVIPEKLLIWIYALAGANVILLIFNNGLVIIWQIIFSLIIFFIPIFLIWFSSKGRAMGYGDVKLSLALSFFMFPEYAYSALVLEFIIGSLFVLLYQTWAFINNRKGLKMKTQIAFAPFIITAFWLSILFNLNILNIV